MDRRPRMAGFVDIAKLTGVGKFARLIRWPPANIALHGLNCHGGQNCQGQGGWEYQVRNS